MKRLSSLVALVVSLMWGSPAQAQISLSGGEQAFTWTKNQSTAETMINNTGLPVVGLWVKVNSATQLQKIDFSIGLTLLWRVDDNEDGTLGGGETDNLDGSPAGTNSWHRAHEWDVASTTGEIGLGGSFPLILAGVGNTTLAAQSISFVPITKRNGLDNGNTGMRIDPPFGIRRSAPAGTVTISPTTAPPFSEEFAVAVTNTDPLRNLLTVTITSPPGTGVQSASASGGGTFTPSMTQPPDGTITWPAPVPAGENRRFDVRLNGLVRPLITSVVFEGTFSGLASPVPVLSSWGLATLVALLLVLGLGLLRQRARS